MDTSSPWSKEFLNLFLYWSKLKENTKHRTRKTCGQGDGQGSLTILVILPRKADAAGFKLFSQWILDTRLICAWQQESEKGPKKPRWASEKKYSCILTPLGETDWAGDCEQGIPWAIPLHKQDLCRPDGQCLLSFDALAGESEKGQKYQICKMSSHSKSWQWQSK